MTAEPGDERAGRAREILVEHLPVAHRLFLEWSAGGPASCFGTPHAEKEESAGDVDDSVVETEEAAAAVAQLAERPVEDRPRALAQLEPSPELVHALLMVEPGDPEGHYEWTGYAVCVEGRRRDAGGEVATEYRREYLEELVERCRLALDVLYRPPAEVDGLMVLLTGELKLGVMSYFDLLGGWFCLGRYASIRGEWAAGRTLLGYAEALADLFDATEHRAWTNLELAALSLSEGTSDCLVTLARVWKTAERGLTARTFRRLGMVTAQACLRLRHPLEARRALDWLERHQPPPAESLEGHHDGVVLWLQAQVLAAGDQRGARHVLEMAAERIAQIPDGPFRQYWQARLLLDRLRGALDEDGTHVDDGWRDGLDLEGTSAPVRRIFDDLGDSPEVDDVNVAVLRLESVGPHGFVRELERESAP